MKRTSVFALSACCLLLLGCQKPSDPEPTPSSPSSESPDPSSVPWVEDGLDAPSLQEETFQDSSGVAFPSPEASEGLTYTLSDTGDSYIVSNKNYGLSSPHLVIPSSYKGLPVTQIASEAFTEMAWLKSVYIPSSITKIGDGAFSQSALETLYFDAKNVGDFNARNWVFYASSSKPRFSVYIGPNVEHIPAHFLEPLSINPEVTPNVVSLRFASSSSLISIGERAFYGLSSLSSVAFPSSLKEIGKSAFEGSGLTEADLGGVSSIGPKAFFQCASLSKVRLGASLKNLGAQAFSYTGLKQIDLSKTLLASVSERAFEGCASLSLLSLPSSCLEIEEKAFASSGLAYLDGQNLAKIGQGAFASCPLKGIRLPSLQKLGDDAFAGNPVAVEKLILGGSIENLEAGNGVFYGLKCKTLLFLEGIETIPGRLFYPGPDVSKAPSFENIYLPWSLKKVKENAFLGAKIAHAYARGNHDHYDPLMSDIEEGNDSLKDVLLPEVKA